MSFAIDANLLLYASDAESPLRPRAVELLDEIAMGPEIAYLFWPVAMAYLRIATHPAIFRRPLSHADARANLQVLLDLPLDTETQAALRGQDNWKRRVLDCVVAYERGDWDKAIDLAGRTAIERTVLPVAHAEALRWSRQLQEM